MKVRLLKKLRRRFYWVRKDARHFCWTFYDRKHNVELYCFKEGMDNPNDMLIHEMLHRIGYGFLFVSLRQRLERKRTKRVAMRLRENYKPYFRLS